MSNKVQVSIGRRCSSVSDDTITILIEDEASGLLIIECEMTLDSFAGCITGMYAQKAIAKSVPTQEIVQNYGKTRIIEKVRIHKSALPNESKNIPPFVKDFVSVHYPSYELWDDGCRSKQPDREYHYASIVKFE